jgi:hypothetical protein
MFKVAVCDASMGVVRGDQVGLDVSWEGVSPVVALSRVVKEDPAHASTSGICGANEGGRLGDKLRDVGAGAEAGCQAAKGGEACLYEGVEANPVGSCLVLSPLEGTEQASGAGDGKGDEPEFSKDAAPAFGADTAEALEAGKDVMEHLFSVRRELNRLVYRVDILSMNELPGAPATIACEELFERDCFVSPVTRLGTREHGIDTVEQVAAQCV